MKNVYWRFGIASNLQSLFDCLQQPIAFISHVSEIATAILTSNPGQGTDLAWLCIHCRRIDQSAGHSNRSGLHSLTSQLLHLLKLSGTRTPLDISQHQSPNLGVANCLHHIDGQALHFQQSEILPHGCVAVAFSILGSQRSRRRTFSSIDGRDSLSQ
jgi:hypothetical protein